MHSDEVPEAPSQFRELFATTQQYEDWLKERRKLFFQQNNEK